MAELLPTDEVTPPEDCLCRDGCILMAVHEECYVPSEEHPDEAATLERIIRALGTDWVRDATEEIEMRILSE